MDDAYDSRRLVVFDSGLIDVVAPSQYNWKAAMRVEVSDEASQLDPNRWDHVVEVPLPVPSRTLSLQVFVGGSPVETQIPPGTSRGSPGAATWLARERSRE
jgi:hypothetical protein